MKNQLMAKDFFWFFFTAIAILSLISIPYWVGNSLETDGVLFRGAYFDEVDYSVHISMMQAGRMGSWAYQLRFTSEDHQPAFLRMYYVLLGHISKWINLGVEPTYHLARWVFGFIALYSIHQLCRMIFLEKKLTRTAFLLSVLGGGAGWIQLLANSPMLTSIAPVDFWLIDAYVFFSVSVFPAFSFTLSLMAASLYWYMDYLTTGSWKAIILVSVFAVLSQVTNPIAFSVLDIGFASAVFFIWWKNRKINLQQFSTLSVIALVQIPLFTYNFLTLARDPLWSQFTLQNQTPSPPLEYYAWGFAPFWVLSIYGIIRAFRDKNPNLITLSAWGISGVVLAYLPFPIQRRFLLGITIPLGILAVYGLDQIIKQISQKKPLIQKHTNLIYFAYILLSSFSMITLILGSSLYMQALPNDKFYPRDVENALLWLDNHAEPNDFVLGNIRTGQIAAQRTRLKTYVGHPMETLFFEDKMKTIEAYYQGELSNDWIQKTPIVWVIYGPYEKEFSKNFIPPPDLELIYQNKTVLIYKVKR